MIYIPQRHFRLCHMTENPPLLLLLSSDASALLLMASWLVAHNLLILFVCIISSNVLPFSEQGTSDSRRREQPVADNIAKSKRALSTDLFLPDPRKSTSIKVNTSLTSTDNASNSTRLNLAAPKVECDSSLYGQRLNVASCQEAWGLLPIGRTLRTVGKREKGKFDIPLPFRVMSGEYDHTASSAIHLPHLSVHVC